MHDYFDIIGVSPRARAQEIRRARHRRLATSHPDVEDGASPRPVASSRSLPDHTRDVAIDFVEMAAVVERMRIAFFTND